MMMRKSLCVVGMGVDVLRGGGAWPGVGRPTEGGGTWNGGGGMQPHDRPFWAAIAAWPAGWLQAHGRGQARGGRRRGRPDCHARGGAARRGGQQGAAPAGERMAIWGGGQASPCSSLMFVVIAAALSACMHPGCLPALAPLPPVCPCPCPCPPPALPVVLPPPPASLPLLAAASPPQATEALVRSSSVTSSAAGSVSAAYTPDWELHEWTHRWAGWVCGGG